MGRRTGCHSCGLAGLPRRARWCPGCGSRLGPEHQAAFPRRRLTRTLVRTLGVTAAAVTVVAVGTQLTEGGAPPPADPAQARVDLSDGRSATTPGGDATEEMPGQRAEGPPGARSSPGTHPGALADPPLDGEDRWPTCDTEGCAAWRSTVLDHQPMAIADGRLVQIRFEEIIAVEESTGRWLWRHSHDDMRVWDPAEVVTAFHLDDRTFALAYGTRLRIHAATTGRVLGEVDVHPTRVNDLRRHDGQLIASGRQRGPGQTGFRVIGLSDDGDVRFDAEVEQLVREDRPATSTTAPLLAVIDGALLRLDATDGHVRWTRPLDDRQLDGTTLLDRATGEVSVLSTRDGSTTLTRTRPGAIAAGVRDGVLTVTLEDRVELYDRDGTALGAVPVTEPARTLVATAGRRIVVAELPEEGGADDAVPALRTGRRAGGSTALPTVLPSSTAPLPPDRSPATVTVMRRPDGLVLAGPDPRDAWLADPVSTTAARLELPTARTREVVHRDGVSLVRDGTRLHVVGADGRFTVERATQIAAVDPLVVHGIHGTLRLERGLVDGTVGGRQAPVGLVGEVQAAPRRPPLQRHGLGLAR